MIARNLFLSLVFVWLGITTWIASEPTPLTASQLQVKAKQASKDAVCKRLKKGSKRDRLCGVDKNILW